jgi:hypothetical protein
MTVLSITSIRILFSIKDIVVVRPLQSSVHVVSHEDAETCTILEFELILGGLSLGFVSDLSPERNDETREGFSIDSGVWRQPPRPDMGDVVQRRKARDGFAPPTVLKPAS